MTFSHFQSQNWPPIFSRAQTSHGRFSPPSLPLNFFQRFPFSSKIFLSNILHESRKAIIVSIFLPCFGSKIFSGQKGYFNCFLFVISSLTGNYFQFVSKIGFSSNCTQAERAEDSAQKTYPYQFRQWWSRFSTLSLQCLKSSHFEIIRYFISFCENMYSHIFKCLVLAAAHNNSNW